MSAFRRIFACSIVAATLAACVVAPEQSDATGKTEQELTLMQGFAQPAFPPGNAQYCGPIVNRYGTTCSIAPSSNPYWIDTAKRFGCSAPQRYTPATTTGGILGGVLSLCPDSPALRTQITSAVVTASFASSTLCDRCIPLAPAGMVYVWWVLEIGPGCQGGCGKTLGTGP